MHSGVSTSPGDTAFTRIGASSSANARTTASTAATAPASIAPVRIGRSASNPDVSTIEPRSQKFPNAARTTDSGPTSRSANM